MWFYLMNRLLEYALFLSAQTNKSKTKKNYVVPTKIYFPFGWSVHSFQWIPFPSVKCCKSDLFVFCFFLFLSLYRIDEIFYANLIPSMSTMPLRESQTNFFFTSVCVSVWFFLFWFTTNNKSNNNNNTKNNNNEMTKRPNDKSIEITVWAHNNLL